LVSPGRDVLAGGSTKIRAARSGPSGDAEFGELLIDLEEDKAAPALIFGLLAEMERT
jgi:hypothetical protein